MWDSPHHPKKKSEYQTHRKEIRFVVTTGRELGGGKWRKMVKKMQNSTYKINTKGVIQLTLLYDM